MTATTQLQTVATNIDEQALGDERIIDFDIDANTDYEIQSCVMVDNDDRVVEAAVRFGKVEEREDLGIGKSLIGRAWTFMVEEQTTLDVVEADLSDFSAIVPHLRVNRDNVEEYGLETLTLDEFADIVAALADLVENVLRGHGRSVNPRFDDYLN
ncbi:hypothetical protein [Halocalculus aciditolerans]|uniref:Uncharacterized protein n=1 Tax=Halocalculus aciditolerans TaxID=1383812 RepID=A0A830F287_9EURY|nr:hypothetical protein [Halocalculus aciditolerans]GGL55282.1 hypothetical protein GCM10009039_11780 [Halocalculus aciditolerans]